jgi:class 3 adenylate cyclase
VLYDAAGARIDAIVERGASLWPAPAALDPALAGGEVVYGEVAAWEGENRLTVVVPVRAGGRITGHALSRISLRPVQERLALLADLRFHGRGETLLVVDRAQRVIAHVDPRLARRLPSLRGEGVVTALEGAAGGGVAAYREVTAVDGRRLLATLVPVAGLPFAVVAHVPREVAYEAHERTRRLVAITVALAAGLAALVAVVFARRLTGPIRALVGHAGALAARRFDERVAVRTRDELALLGAAMNDAAAELLRSEERERREAAIRADLGRYLPAELVEKIVRREQDMALGGRRQVVTVLFADVAAFTPIAEKLPAEAVVGILNELFTMLTEIVFRHRGTVDKFIGDCVLAMWGAPAPAEDHAARALAAAQDMLRWLEAGRIAWRDRHGVDVRLAIGVNSGEAIVGNVGSDTRMEYTAIGDTVNVAARLEQLARPGQILCTAATRAAAGGAFDFVPCGPRELTGRSGTVELFEVPA